MLRIFSLVNPDIKNNVQIFKIFFFFGYSNIFEYLAKSNTLNKYNLIAFLQ